MATRYCLIIGAGAGVSMGVARKFASEGFSIILMARNAGKLTTLVEALQSDGHEARHYALDVSEPAAIASIFATMLSDIEGGVEVLHYNVGVQNGGKPSTLSADEMLSGFKANVMGAVLCAQQVIPAMRERGNGTLLFTGGGLALNPYPDYASLGIGKAGLRNVVYALHRELQDEGIYVGTVTIAGFVQAGTHFDPDKIADVFWELYTERHEVEIIYK